ncbi:MAG: aldehyde dehydrogenase family protein [Candidatus Sericytochromatia bacterium]
MFTPNQGPEVRVYGPTLVDPSLRPLSDQSPGLCTYNPASRSDCVGIWPVPSAERLTSALQQASVAAHAWAQLPQTARQEIFTRFDELLTAHETELSRLLSRETGQLLAQSKEMIPSLRPLRAGDAPLPAALLLQTLLAGQAIVWLGAHLPALSTRWCQLFAQAGLPEGLLQHIWLPAAYGHLANTDALPEGVRLMGPSAPASPPSLPPFVLRDDMSLDAAVQSASEAAYTHAAQAPFGRGLILLPTQRAAAFRTRFLKASENLSIGDPLLNQRIHYGPLPDQAHLDTFLDQLQRGQQAGAKLLMGKGRISREHKPKNFVGDPEGLYVWPQIWDQVTPEMVRNGPPLVGPTVRLLEVPDQGTAMALARML